MFIRKHFVTNSSSTNFVIVTRDDKVTVRLLKDIGFNNPKVIYNSYYDDPEYFDSQEHASLEDIAKAMNEGDPSYGFEDEVLAEHIDMITYSLFDNLPHLVARADTPEDAEAFYDGFFPVNLWATYQNILAAGYKILLYAATDYEPCSIHAEISTVSVGTYPGKDGEFIYVERQ